MAIDMLSSQASTCFPPRRHFMDDDDHPSSWEKRCGQRVASLTGASVFDIMRAPRGAAPLMWKQWQTTDADALW
jgi:hypothetical protein